MRNLIAFIRISLKDTLSYRGDMAMYTASGVILPLISLVLWTNTNLGDTQFFIQYYIFLFFVGLLCSNWESYFISRAIRLGEISPYLVKPASFFSSQLGNNIGEKTMKLIFLIPIIILIARLYDFTFPAQSVYIWVAFLISTLIAAAIGFVIDFCLGISAFWLEDSAALREIFAISSLVFSGRFVPLSVLPEFWKNLSYYLPFRYSLSLPLEIITGEIKENQVPGLLLIQVLVLITAGLICKYLWKRGVMRYSASGS